MNNLKTLINLALAEDIGSGDVTSAAVIPSEANAFVQIRAKQNLVPAGIGIAGLVFKKTDGKIEFFPKVKDGSFAKKGAVLATAAGPARSLLAAERTALNFVQHLTGIATLTKKFADRLKGTRAKLLDTRKTTPGWRTLEKYAVKMGGGTNHRIGLFDMYLVKNNHIAAAGSVTEAVRRIRNSMSGVRGLKIEVEVKNLGELNEALGAGADVVMLDNFTVRAAKKAVSAARRFKSHKPKLEISGNVNLKNIRAYAKTGVDFISAGAVTHSAPAADIHLKIISLKA